MKADPTAQRRLLDLQTLDTAVAQLTHRRAGLPELAQLARLDERSKLLRSALADLGARIGDLGDAQRRLENDVDTVRTRSGRDEQRLQAGGLPGKELERIQHEITSLGRRQSALEDELLEFMEQRESLDSELAIGERERDEIAADATRLTHSRDEAWREIDAELAERTGARAGIAGEVPADLLGLYERIRTSSGGIGAAALHQRRCEGCRIELAGNELSAARAAAADDVLRCENCRRILVRTADSGL